MKRVDTTNVQEAGESKRLPEGGYVCRIRQVEDMPEKELLKIEFDIAEGEFRGYYQGLFEAREFWGGRWVRSYKEKSLPFFKRFCAAVTKSNAGYVFDGNVNADESTLAGKLIGLVLGMEEYEGNDGTVRERTFVDREYPVADIRSGNFKVPEKKLLPKESAGSESFMKIDNSGDELPFN